jgi:hypothetical protein
MSSLLTECADDIALLSTQLSDAQIMVNMALDFANLEGYELQPKKSVATHIRGNNKQCQTTNEKLNMGNIYKRLGPDSSSVMTGFVLVSFFWKSSSCSRGFEDGNNSSIP